MANSLKGTSDMNIKSKITSMLVTTLFVGISSSFAGDLTLAGAIATSNKSGEIPLYTGSKIEVPKGWSPGMHYENPFPGDATKFVINKSNSHQYASKLSEGQKHLIEQFEDYQLPVYQTRRTVRYTPRIVEGTKKNLKKAYLSKDGNGVVGLAEGFPFPILSDDSSTAALQAIWNHITRFRGGSLERSVTQISVSKGQYQQPVALFQKYSRAEYIKGNSKEQNRNILFYYIDKITAPSRLTGTVTLLHETLNQSKDKRRAWLYNSAQRRVRRAPVVAFDSPVDGTIGIKVIDSMDMFNGSPERYDWTYLGREEKFIPYNSYKLASNQLKYKDIVGAQTVNSNLTRWELHRVHKVVATLKKGQRHIYGKRVFYLDEDSWAIALSEEYDNKGNLWRISEGHLMNFYDRDVTTYASEITYDLLRNSYFVFGLSNEESFSYKFGKEFKKSDFTPAALRRSSRG